MKCPHCDYFDGWDPATLEIVKGDKGAYYTSNCLKVLARKDYGSYSGDEISNAIIVGCPNCRKIFMRTI